MSVRANRTQFPGARVDGVELFVLENNEAKSGPVRVTCTNFGATLTGVTVLAGGERRQITIGFDNAEEYLTNPAYYGSTVGPVANRIGGASFQLDGKTYKLEKNEGQNSLHSGPKASFAFKHFSTETFSFDGVGGLHFSYIRPSGEGGFPGDLNVSVYYILTDSGELIFHYRVTTDEASPVNLTNHAYWNLAGEGSGSIGDHLLQIHSSKILQNSAGLIPTGQFTNVENQPEYDFRTPKKIGKDLAIFANRVPAGYDDCYVIESDRTWTPGPKLTGAALSHAGLQAIVSSRAIRETAVLSVPDLKMKVYTDQPAVQFYSGIHLNGKNSRSGRDLKAGDALCLETQGYNDAVHHPHFPSWILQPGLVYTKTTVHSFSAS